jgi:DNA polymerase-3 subunit epsilon
LYAILDIETTGGQFNEEGLPRSPFTNLMVMKSIIDFSNPEIPIQPFVVKLTGINNAMLQTAQSF